MLQQVKKIPIPFTSTNNTRDPHVIIRSISMFFYMSTEGGRVPPPGFHSFRVASIGLIIKVHFGFGAEQHTLNLCLLFGITGPNERGEFREVLGAGHFC